MELPIAFPIHDYAWESHLDASLPDGANALLPSPWLASRLGLLPDRADASAYCDESGVQRFIGSRLEPDGSSALVDAEVLQAYLDEQLLDCIWLFVAERNVSPGGHIRSTVWRRSAGYCRLKGGKPVAETWTDDRISGN